MEYWPIIIISSELLGPVAIFFPNLIKKLTDRFPFLFYILVTLAIFIQFLFVFFILWNQGHSSDNLFEMIYEKLMFFTVPFFFFLLIYIGLGFQKIWKIKEQSYGIAIVGSLISTPLLYMIIAKLIAD